MKINSQPDTVKIDNGEFLEILSAAIEAKTGRRVNRLRAADVDERSYMIGRAIEVSLTFELCPAETPQNGPTT